MDEDEVTLSDLDDAVIEDTVHCDLCHGSYLVSDAGPVIIEAEDMPGSGKLGGQLKLCENCARRVHDEYREHLREAGLCEHGVNDGEYCRECSREYHTRREV